MALFFAWFVAFASLTLSLSLWFRDVRRIMNERMNVVEIAAGQLSVFRDRAFKSREDPKAAAVFERSERIYQQAVDIYNFTLQKPWNRLPARMMGFRRVSDKETI